MALQDDLVQGFFKKVTHKQDKRLSQKDGSRARLFDEPDSESKKLREESKIDKENFKKPGTQPRTQPETNRGQTRDTVEDKLGTNQGQTRDKPGTDIKEIGDKPGTNQRQTRDKLGTNWGHNQGQNLDKSEAKLSRKVDASCETNIGRPSFLALSGIKRRVLISLYKLCDFSKNLETSPLSSENIAQNCNTLIDTAKKSLRRLEKEGFIQRLKYKCGRGGWTVYALNEIVYQEIRVHLNCDNSAETRDKPGTNWGQIGDTLGTQSGTQPRTEHPYSSNLNNNLSTTTTIENTESDLPPEWEEIDCSNLYEIKFGYSQIKQIFRRGVLSAEQVQSSIDAFAFDIRVNQKDKQIKGDPLRFFIGILIKGGVYNPPSNYVDPIADSLRRYAESQKEARERVEASLSDIKAEELQRWVDSLSESESENFIPEELKKSIAPKMVLLERQKKNMQSHFEELIWPKIRKELIGNIPNFKNG